MRSDWIETYKIMDFLISGTGNLLLKLSRLTVIYWHLTEPSIKRCTCVKKWKQVCVMKEYKQMPAAVELVGDRKARVRASLQTEGYGPQQPQPRCVRSAAMVRRRSWVNIAACPCLHSSVTHHRNIENKVWEIHIFIKKCVCSFIEVRHYVWLCFCLYLYVSIQHHQLNFFHK